MAIKTIDFRKNFPIQKTAFWLIEEKGKEKERIENYFNYLKEKFPNSKDAIDKKMFGIYWPSGFLAGISTQFLNPLNTINKENEVLNIVKEYAKTELTKLLTIEEGKDDDTIKLLKEVANEQKEVVEKQIDNWKSWVAGLDFFIDSVKTFYLKDLPEYIKDKLSIDEPPLKLEELDQEKLKEYVDSIFSTLYIGFTSTEKETDFANFKDGIDTNLTDLKDLINETSNNKPVEPTEDIEAIKAELKVYKDTFDYMFPDSSDKANTIKDWWNSTKEKWATSFQGKYEGLYSDSLAKLKKDWDDREQQINNWLTAFPISEYPKGAEGVLKLFNSYKGYLKSLAETYKQEQEYDFESEDETTTEKN